MLVMSLEVISERYVVNTDTTKKGDEVECRIMRDDWDTFDTEILNEYNSDITSCFTDPDEFSL